MLTDAGQQSQALEAVKVELKSTDRHQNKQADPTYTDRHMHRQAMGKWAFGQAGLSLSGTK